MSQFFFVAGKTPSLDGLSNVDVIPLDRAEDIVVRAARDLSVAADWPSCWYLRDRGGCTDTLFTEAQAALLDGASFEQTRLYSLFSRTLPTAKGIALWYGDDWSDLQAFAGFYGTIQQGSATGLYVLGRDGRGSQLRR